MIIIWSGWGLLVLLYGFLGVVAAVELPQFLGAEQDALCFLIGGIVAAALSWVIGSRLPGRLFLSPQNITHRYISCSSAPWLSILPDRRPRQARTRRDKRQHRVRSPAPPISHRQKRL